MIGFQTRERAACSHGLLTQTPAGERGRTPSSQERKQKEQSRHSGLRSREPRFRSPQPHVAGAAELPAQRRHAHRLRTFPWTLLGRTPHLRRGPQASPGLRASPGHWSPLRSHVRSLGPLGTPGGRRRLAGFCGAFPRLCRSAQQEASLTLASARMGRACQPIPTSTSAPLRGFGGLKPQRACKGSCSRSRTTGKGTFW